MNVLVFAESDQGVYKKSSFEAVSYGRNLADSKGGQCFAVSINGDDSVDLGSYGAHKVYKIKGGQFDTFEAAAYAEAIHSVMEASGATFLVGAQTYSGKAVLPMVAVKQNAALLTGVVALPENGQFKKTCFSNKAFAHVEMNADKNVVALVPNSNEVKDGQGSAEVEEFQVEQATPKTTSVEIDRVKGKIPLTEAELVVSAGRGLKGPENWGMVEELADLLGAATACSKPVSDMEWRPHSEHVGQTGITIKPDLYIAIGISGAIQHLAGVGSSKTIVVINTDPEAPFFKAADYGIVGDAFEVVPRLISKLKEVKAA